MFGLESLDCDPVESPYAEIFMSVLCILAIIVVGKVLRTLSEWLTEDNSTLQELALVYVAKFEILCLCRECGQIYSTSVVASFIALAILMVYWNLKYPSVRNFVDYIQDWVFDTIPPDYTWKMYGMYIAANVAGTLSSRMLSRWLWSWELTTAHQMKYQNLPSSGSLNVGGVQGFTYEFLGTFLCLLGSYCSVYINCSAFWQLSISSCFSSFMSRSFCKYTGGYFNPIQSFASEWGTEVLRSPITYLSVYWIGPISGALLAKWICKQDAVQSWLGPKHDSKPSTSKSNQITTLYEKDDGNKKLD